MCLYLYLYALYIDEMFARFQGVGSLAGVYYKFKQNHV